MAQMQRKTQQIPVPLSRNEKARRAAIAKALARSEFGRFHTDDARQQETRRSVSDQPATATQPSDKRFCSDWDFTGDQLEED